MKPIFLRIITLFLLLTALFDPHLSLLSDQKNAAILVDISESFPEAYRSQGLMKARKLAGSEAAIKYFASSTEEPINRSETNLSKALQSVTAKNIFLVSDGWENKGSVSDIYRKLIDKSVKVFPLIEEVKESVGRCGITLLSTPLNAGRNASVPVTTIIENTLSKTCTGTLIVHHGVVEIFNQHISINPGSESRFETVSDPKQEGLTSVHAEFKPDDGASGSEKTKYISVTEREKILIISGNETDIRALRPVLDAQNYKANYVYGADASKISSDELKTYATFILNNVAIKQLSRDLLDSIKALVAEGKGLVTFGGERGYGLGGYRDSSIEEAMPVENLPPQTEEKRLNAAVQLVIDKSQSMSQQSRLDFVKSAAKEVIMGLKPDDYLGVIAFDSQPFVVIPIGRLQDIKQTALSQIENIFPTGSTRMLRALQDAGRLIERVPAGRLMMKGHIH